MPALAARSSPVAKPPGAFVSNGSSVAPMAPPSPWSLTGPSRSLGTPTTPVQKLSAANPFEALAAVRQLTGIYRTWSIAAPENTTGAPFLVANIGAVQVGDIVFAHFEAKGANLFFDQTFTAAGWTNLGTIRSDLAYIAVLYRIIDGSEGWSNGGSQIFTIGGTTDTSLRASGRATAYRGARLVYDSFVHQDNGFPGGFDSSGAQLLNVPGGGMMLVFMGFQWTGSFTVSEPNGVTIVYDYQAPQYHLGLTEKMMPPGSFYEIVNFSSSQGYKYCMASLAPLGAIHAESRAVVKKTKDPTAYRKKVLANNPALYATFDLDYNGDLYNVCHDESVNAKVGYYATSSMATLVAALNQGGGQAAQFDGATQSAGFSSIGTGPSGGTQLVVEALVKGASIANGMIVSCIQDSTPANVFQFYISATGKVVLGIWDTGNTPHTYTGSISVNDGAVHHIAGTYDGTTIKVYVDGNADGAGLAVTFTMRTTYSPVFIGKAHSFLSGADSNRFNGTLDEVAIYSTIDSHSSNDIKSRAILATSSLPDIQIESNVTVTRTAVEQIESRKSVKTLLGATLTELDLVDSSAGTAHPFGNTDIEATAQSFTPTASWGAVEYVDAFIYRTGASTDSVQCKIVGEAIGSTGPVPDESNVLATSAAISAANFGIGAGAASIVRFSFPTPAVLTPGVHYYVVFRRTGGLDAALYYAIRASGTNLAGESAMHRTH